MWRCSPCCVEPEQGRSHRRSPPLRAVDDEKAPVTVTEGSGKGRAGPASASHSSVLLRLLDPTETRAFFRGFSEFSGFVR